MSTRDADLLWLRDILEHLRACQQQLEWAQDPAAVHYLTEAMLRDLDCCRRICQNLHRQTQAVASLN